LVRRLPPTTAGWFQICPQRETSPGWAVGLEKFSAGLPLLLIYSFEFTSAFRPRSAAAAVAELLFFDVAMSHSAHVREHLR